MTQRKEKRMVGLFALLTPEQRKAALEYKGQDCIGDKQETDSNSREIKRMTGFARRGQ